MKVSIIGTGYVGLVTGACFAHMGNIIICADVDEQKISTLNEGQIPIHEPGLQEIVLENASTGRLSFTTDIKAAVKASEFIFIAVGTPRDRDGSADLQQVLSVAKVIGQALDNNTRRIIITKSTVPVGTTKIVKETIAKVLATRGKKHPFEVVSNPEFLKEGKAVSDFLNPDRIVIGTDSTWAKERMQTLYDPFRRTDEMRIIFMDIPSAELTKYAANAMLATRISFMNELAAIAEATGADIDQVRVGIGSDNRIGRRFLFAGVGYGGSCFPKDIRALISTATEIGVQADILAAVDRVNQAQPLRLVKKIKDYYGPEGMVGKTIAVWGLAFKPETDDVRESPAAVIIKSLIKEGAQVRAFDPVAEHSFADMYKLPITYSREMYDCLAGADALVLITEWHQFRRPDFTRMRELLTNPLIFDGRNQYEPVYVKERGFTYISIGRETIKQAE
ncbi:MAG: UDP-glucose/GDP-mannose dehydrogenase family protein [Fidelibacterota bacterium]|nr:MAG: UDP-glucose/GDP-mannose dehydrogenase family protein [Candidatus Neomarinimicrobiota bacterium]